MRFFLCAAALITVCSSAPVARAQLNILGGSGTPTPAPRLVAAQDDSLLLDGPAKGANPFDFFAEEDFDDSPVQAEVGGSNATNVSRGTIQPPSAIQPPIATPAPSPSLNSELRDPGSLNVGLGHRRHAGNAIAAQAMVASVPNATFAPVHWGYQTQTPHPVAEFLLRQQCVDGLWAGYQAQRQAECVAMWNHLYGHHCGSCAGNCHGCGSVNRYTGQRYASSCDAAPSCGNMHCDGGCTTCTANKAKLEMQAKRANSSKVASQILSNTAR